MAINFTRYIDITSGVGAAANVSTRDLITRLFSDNNLIPPQSFLEFDNADDVETYFGDSSTEFAYAEFYFGWISKNITAPQKISFARWVDAAVGGMIFGRPGSYILSTFTAITAGAFTLTLGGHTATLGPIDLSGAASLAAVAADVQAAIRAVSAGGTPWTSATVTFDATRGCFDLVSGSLDTDPVAVVAGVSHDLAGPLGWLTGAILCSGSAVETPVETLTNSIQASNNFGTFLFIPALEQIDFVNLAVYNATQNNMFMMLVPVSADNASAISAALLDLPGCAMTLSPLSGEYPELIPGMIEAATNYLGTNSTQNYMFQQFAVTPSVTDDADANTYDALRVNYYGQTQTAGQFLAFYQRGFLTGLPVDPVDMNTYANEQWLKDAAAAALMTLLLALAKVSANAGGRAQILATIQTIINQALTNGTISVGKPLSTIQQLFITNATNDPKAWYQVQNGGYWVNCSIQSYVNNGVTEWEAVYTLIYAKDDVIRKIVGTHVLI